jgi:gas vesicle protein
MTDEKDTHQSSFISGFVLGSFAGAAALFLLSSNKGRQIAKEILKEVEDAIGQTDIVGEEVEEIVEETVRKAEKHTETIAKEVAATKEELSEGLVEKLDDTLSKIEEIQLQGIELTKGLQQKFFKRKK